MRTLTAFVLALFLAGPLSATVVRPAPAFSWVDSSGSAKSSKDFLGRSVILLIANSPRQWAFRSQVGQLQQIYERLAAEKIVCVAAFSQAPGVVRSNIPFVTAADGPRVAFAFEAGQGFAIALIGKDGNLDYFGGKVLPTWRISDILDGSFSVQQSLRRQ